MALRSEAMDYLVQPLKCTQYKLFRGSLKEINSQEFGLSPQMVYKMAVQTIHGSFTQSADQVESCE